MTTKPNHVNSWKIPGKPALLAFSLIACLLMPAKALAAFGVTDNGTEFVVDTGAGLVFKVNKSGGNIDSWVYNGTEYNGPSGKGSEIASGLGSTGTTVTATNLGNVIQVTIQATSANTVCANLTHYIIVTNGMNNVYMASYLTQEPGVGEFRWITRLAWNLLPNGPAPSDNNGSTGAIESSDVFGHADGTTTSKYYGDGVTHSKDRALEMTYCGATGNNVGVWMVFGSRESSSGGPFYRDIQNQGDGANSDQEIYNYMNSGHEQIEAWRTNVLYGPYVLVWNNGSTPTLPIDTSWIGSLGLTGFVDASGRGTVSGTTTGIDAGIQGVVGLANTTAQYWGLVDSNGNYTISSVKAGAYTAILYQGELGVATNSSVTVNAGSTTTLNLASGWPHPSTVFQIGDWDGTPQGFMNATNILGFSLPNFITMHPSDVRMNNWGASNVFNVGTDPISTFPSILMRGTNSNTFINFNLSSGQITNLTLKIGATDSYNGGRPDVKINGTDLGFPGAPNEPKSRSWTVGTYRGNNVLWTWSVPTSDLIVGQNTFDISAVSGSTDLSPWLSAGWVYDAVELDGPAGSSNTNPPAAPTGLSAAGGNAVVNLNWTQSTSPGITGNNVYRSITGSGGPYNLQANLAATTSYSDTAVTNGNTYFYTVTAVNANGESSMSAYAGATPTAPPAAPTGLTATTVSSSQINLSWIASSGATSYNVKRATVSGGPYTTVATSVTTTYSNTGLSSGTTYYYVVSAVNAGGESANSAQAVATTIPAAPTGLTATAGNAQVALTWTASTGATSYNVKRATVSGGPYTVIASSTTIDYTDTNVVNGTTYYYVVSAVDSGGESANSSEVNATPSAPVTPAAPTNLTASAGHKKVTLTWTQSSSPNITTNNVYRATVNGGPYTKIAAIAATTTYSNTGLSSGTTYYFVVTAVNSSGLESPYSNQASATAR